MLVFTDLGAEMVSRSEQWESHLAVEIKVLSGSLMTDFEKAAGQYDLYRFLLKRKGAAQELFPALSQEVYKSLQEK